MFFREWTYWHHADWSLFVNSLPDNPNGRSNVSGASCHRIPEYKDNNTIILRVSFHKLRHSSYYHSYNGHQVKPLRSSMLLKCAIFASIRCHDNSHYACPVAPPLAPDLNNQGLLPCRNQGIPQQKRLSATGKVAGVKLTRVSHQGLIHEYSQAA